MFVGDHEDCLSSSVNIILHICLRWRVGGLTDATKGHSKNESVMLYTYLLGN